MQLAGIEHRPESEDAAVVGKFQVLLRLKTPLQTIQRVEVNYADPYLWPTHQPLQRADLHPGVQTESQQYWCVTLTVPTRRLMYAFRVVDQTGQSMGYGDAGFFKDQSAEWAQASQYFHYPFTWTSAPPTWAGQTVWYQIFPDRFADGDDQRNPGHVRAWGQLPVTRSSVYGGDLAGITDHLDDLATLGINGLYLCPLFAAPSNHKYDPTNEFQIDPQFGDEADLHRLVQVAHAHGMKIMLDAVFNHLGAQAPQWQSVLKFGASSPYADWFDVASWPVRTQPVPNYATFGTEPTMPKLNTQLPAVQAYLAAVARYWTVHFDIDAWRFDVADEVAPVLWRALTATLRTLKPDIYLVGEAWHRAQALVGPGKFDAAMNYPLTRLIAPLFNRTLSPASYVAKTNRQLMQYRWPNQAVMLNALDTHDTPRLWTTLHGHLARFKAALALLMLLPGSPCLYYGTEIGLRGGADPDNRRCMDWQPTADGRRLREFVKQLVKFRRQNAPQLNAPTIKWASGADWLTLQRGQLCAQFNLSARVQPIQIAGDVQLGNGVIAGVLVADGFVITRQ
ncbi:glycoside hydrolase family 13 protein [Lactiplantibacillus modestisalitolerans]|uniref:Glycoside hydrolase family 13 protein n=1 Tax=Lactiplantibacillus modestisalitolerans TaxID=1457219 RepID=A0ABV5WW84_9LACO|nr:glycoside hydrolase family 13 protein [Lactiplantibacillus modestisalitolerans]